MNTKDFGIIPNGKLFQVQNLRTGMRTRPMMLAACKRILKKLTK